MEKNTKININDENMRNKIFTYIIWAILILSPLYTFYFSYSLARGLPIIYDRIPSMAFFVAGVLTFYDILSVNQIMTSGD